MSWLIGIGIAVLIGLLLSYVAWKMYDRYDDRLDAFQLKVNKIENKFAAAGANWLSDLFALVVVGDEEKIGAKIGEALEAANTSRFLLENVFLHTALYAIRECPTEYPEGMVKIYDALGIEFIADEK